MLKGGFGGFDNSVPSFALAVTYNRRRIFHNFSDTFNVNLRLSWQRYCLDKILNDLAGVKLKIFARQLNQRIKNNFVLRVLEIATSDKNYGRAYFFCTMRDYRDRLNIFPNRIRNYENQIRPAQCSY